MTQTEVIWDLPSDPAADQAVLAKAQELEAQGKQAATPLTIIRGMQRITARWWIDEPTAVSWIEFCEQYNPFSATIINNP
jgi:hypothetical protein